MIDVHSPRFFFFAEKKSKTSYTPYDRHKFNFIVTSPTTGVSGFHFVSYFWGEKCYLIKYAIFLD